MTLTSKMATPDAVPALVWTDPSRQTEFKHWLSQISAPYQLLVASLRPASSDASFRRYFRIDTLAHERAPAGSFIIMDAPPSHEDCRPFLRVAELLAQARVHVPQVLEACAASGFLLLTDLGSTTYLNALLDPLTGAQRSHQLMLDAIDALVRLQATPAQQLAPYDAALQQREMDLFEQWYLGRHCGLSLNAAQRQTLQASCGLILSNTLGQASVFVHRDYHSRNLMVTQPNPGILDFQDAVHGPISYDLVSLLRDAYIPWDEALQIDYAARYWDQARRSGLPVPDEFDVFWRDFEWMGLQRQLKVLGIFARLAYRDGKKQYLDDLAVVWDYAHKVCTRYHGLGGLAVLLEEARGLEREQGYTF